MQPAAAGLPRRLAAAGYDLLLVGGLLMTTSFAVVAARGGTAIAAGSASYRIFLTAQVALFFVGFWWRGGQTLGMRAWALRVEMRNGEPLTLATACLRFVAALLSAAPLGLGFLWALGDAERRTWHDRLSGTRVVRVPVSERARGRPA